MHAGPPLPPPQIPSVDPQPHAAVGERTVMHANFQIGIRSVQCALIMMMISSLPIGLVMVHDVPPFITRTLTPYMQSLLRQRPRCSPVEMRPPFPPMMLKLSQQPVRILTPWINIAVHDPIPLFFPPFMIGSFASDVFTCVII